MVAARLTSARPGSVVPLSKSFTLLRLHLWLQFLEVFEMDIKHLVVLSPAYLFTPPPPLLQQRPNK
jgi:hypothetical protein